MTNPRIRWTSRERDAVIASAAKKLNAGLRIGEALWQGQQVLEPDRWRSKTSLATGGDLIALVRKLASTTIPAKRLEAPVAIEHVELPSPPPVEVSSAHLVPQMESSIDSLVQAIADKIAANIKTEVIKAVKELEHEFKVAKHNPEYATENKRKPHVIIVGLRPDQESIIEQEYSNRYTFKFVATDDAKHFAIAEADAYLLMKNFISHAVFNRYQILKNHVLIDGGMTALRGWLSTKGAEL